jgi:hypothetical protein
LDTSVGHVRSYGVREYTVLCRPDYILCMGSVQVGGYLHTKQPERMLMGIRGEIQKEIVKLQQKLARIEGMPEDTHPIGTIVVFAPSQGKKYHFIKEDEETWRSMKGGPVKELIAWIEDSVGKGYFEVYVMEADNQPIFASE